MWKKFFPVAKRWNLVPVAPRYLYNAAHILVFKRDKWKKNFFEIIWPEECVQSLLFQFHYNILGEGENRLFGFQGLGSIISNTQNILCSKPLSLRCLGRLSNTVLSVRYIFSIQTTTKWKTEKQNNKHPMLTKIIYWNTVMLMISFVDEWNVMSFRKL